MISLDIFSDPVCPWCYIGKTYLDRALESAADHPFAIAWHPFQLNPDMPQGGMDRLDYLSAKFGGRAQVAAIQQRLVQVAKEAGLAIDFDAIARIPNTRDAHRLIHWAGLEGRQSAMVGRLFRAYWREGKDIGDAPTLAKLAEDAGMDQAATLRLLRGDADIDTVTARDAHARARGVNAVPCFIIANHYVVSGAQPVQMWQDAIAELTAASQAEAKTPDD